MGRPAGTSRVTVNLLDVIKNEIVLHDASIPDAAKFAGIKYKTMANGIHRDSVIAKRYRVFIVGEIEREIDERDFLVEEYDLNQKSAFEIEWDKWRLLINPKAARG